jgi:hypothetical protein
MRRKKTVRRLPLQVVVDDETDRMLVLDRGGGLPPWLPSAPF